MLRAFTRAFQETLHNLRSNFFQTLLSVLGIIIGVGALVTMLSLIDGLEQLARDRIADRTSLENITVVSNTSQTIDEVRVDKDTVARLNLSTMEELLAALPYAGFGQLMTNGNTTMINPRTDSLLGIRTLGISLPFMDTTQFELLVGRVLNQEDQLNKRAVTNINDKLARRLLAENDSLNQALGLTLEIDGRQLVVVGIISSAQPQLAVAIPLVLLENDANQPLPQLILGLKAVDEVSKAKEFTTKWLEQRYPGIDDPFELSSSEFWLKELERGFLLFRVVMSMIVGIAVVVGGVGVMNVLLMSITARTAEIGVRKAVGANRSHIITQFLSESIAISLVGSSFGVILGVVVALAVAPAMSFFVPDLEFHAVFTLRTLLTVGVLAVIIGIIFGTYPARRAAGLDPVEAIRRT